MTTGCLSHYGSRVIVFVVSALLLVGEQSAAAAAANFSHALSLSTQQPSAYMKQRSGFLFASSARISMYR